MPIWLQIALGAALISALVRPAPESATSIPVTLRPQLDALWRRFSAVKAILDAQSRRFADVDATLGVVALFELTAAFWFLDKAYAMAHPQAGAVVIAWCMAVPLAIAVAAMRFIGGLQAPEALDFALALERDEEEALEGAIGETLDAFEINRARLRAKEVGVNLAIALFAALLVADGIGRGVRWW